MRLFIAASAALITASGVGVGTAALRTSGPHAVADFCLADPTNVTMVCVSHLCVGYDINGGNPLPIGDPQCPATPLPNSCNLNLPPSVSDLMSCVPPVGPVSI